MVFYRNTHNSRGGNIIEDVPALCVYLSSSLYISHIKVFRSCLRYFETQYPKMNNWI